MKICPTSHLTIGFSFGSSSRMAFFSVLVVLDRAPSSFDLGKVYQIRRSWYLIVGWLRRKRQRLSYVVK